MIKAERLINFLKRNSINFFSGVPDSVLKPTKKYLEREKEHFVTANEGIAASLCIGYHLATGKLPCLYLQNSGLSNAINPLISIAHHKIYSIPMIILIGWRGAPKTKDEPQHIVKGSVTTKFLKSLGIKYCLLEKESDFKS